MKEYKFMVLNAQGNSVNSGIECAENVAEALEKIADFYIYDYGRFEVSLRDRNITYLFTIYKD